MSVLSRFWVPKSARPAFQCLVPGCEHPTFTEGERVAYGLHVAKCAERHRDEIEQTRAEAGRDTYFMRPADEEFAEWMRQNTRL